MTVLIAGGGIAGLTMALTCHQIGVPALVLESVQTLLERVGSDSIRSGHNVVGYRNTDDGIIAAHVMYPVGSNGASQAIPVGILAVVDERCGGYFDDIDDVIQRAEIESYMENHKSAAGFAIESLNASPPTISPDARVSVVPDPM